MVFCFFFTFFWKDSSNIFSYIVSKTPFVTTIQFRTGLKLRKYFVYVEMEMPHVKNRYNENKVYKEMDIIK